MLHPGTQTAHRLSGTFSRVVASAILGCSFAAAPVFAEPLDLVRPETVRLAPAEQRELDHLIEDLRDAKLDGSRRRRAAAILLDRGWPAAIATFQRLLGPAGEISTQRAIAQAIVDTDVAPAVLIQPLLKLLESPETELRHDAAAALGRFDDQRLVKQLIAMTGDAKLAETARQGAVRALSEHRQREVAQVLLKLAASAEPSVRSVAFESLGRLAGIGHFGDDLGAWQRWWERMSKLPSRRWQASLMRNISSRNTDINKQVDFLTNRLLTTYNRLYNATAEAARAEVLQQMLGDELESVRMLALKLIERRVLNAQAVPEEVRALMRQRLADTSSAIRGKAAMLLENLADPAGARLAVELLLSEPVEQVQAAYLALLARVPLSEAVEPALLLMQREGLRPAATSFFVAAADAQVLRPDQAQRALTIVRGDLSAGKASDPVALRLLGRIGKPDDEAILVNHLNHESDQMRLAAATALGAERWSLKPLLAYMGDSTLGATVIQIAGRRASELATLLQLLEHEPADPDQTQPWRDAVLAVTGRLDAESLISLHKGMLDQPERQDLHEQMLKLAAAPPPMDITPDAAAKLETRRTEAEFLLARFYLQVGQPAKAKPVVERLTGRETLPVEQRRRLALLQLSTMLHQLQADEAAAFTSKLLTDTMAPPADQIAGAWLDVIEQATEAGETAFGRTLADRAALIFDGKLGEAVQGRMMEVRQALPDKPKVPALPPVAPDAPAPPAASGTPTTSS